MKSIDTRLMEQLCADAEKSTRRRSHHNLHENLDDPIHRLCMAMEPGTYVRPHRHPEQDKWEFILVLQGSVQVLHFDDSGAIIDKVLLEATGETRGVETPAGVWHALAAMVPGTVVLEVKPGPYCPTSPENFAAWAPAEGDTHAADVEAWYRRAKPGSRMLPVNQT